MGCPYIRGEHYCQCRVCTVPCLNWSWIESCPIVGSSDVESNPECVSDNKLPLWLPLQFVEVNTYLGGARRLSETLDYLVSCMCLR